MKDDRPVESYILPNGKLRSEVTKRKRMKGVSKKRRKSRTGKLGIVRLKGADLEALRRACFERDNWKCVLCGIFVSWDGSGYMNIAGSSQILSVPRGEMAHIKARRNGGDTLDNVRTLCPECHRLEHAYGPSGVKPCPKKERHADAL